MATTSKDYILPILLLAGVLLLVTCVLSSVTLSLRNKEDKKKQYQNTFTAFIVFAILTLVLSTIVTALNDDM